MPTRAKHGINQEEMQHGAKPPHHHHKHGARIHAQMIGALKIGPPHKLGALALHGNQTHRQLLVSTLLSSLSMQKVTPKASQLMKKAMTKERKVTKKASNTTQVTLTIQKATKKASTIQKPVPVQLTLTLAKPVTKEHGCTGNVQTSAASITNASGTGTGVHQANQKVIKASAKHQT